MTDHTITYVPIELVGGPRDGERVMWINPPPPVIIVPMPDLPQVIQRDSALPSAGPHLRLGEYRPTERPHYYTHISVQYEALQKSRGEMLAILLAEATALFEYDWCGEG